MALDSTPDDLPEPSLGTPSSIGDRDASTMPRALFVAFLLVLALLAAVGPTGVAADALDALNGTSAYGCGGG